MHSFSNINLIVGIIQFYLILEPYNRKQNRHGYYLSLLISLKTLPTHYKAKLKFDWLSMRMNSYFFKTFCFKANNVNHFIVYSKSYPLYIIFIRPPPLLLESCFRLNI